MDIFSSLFQAETIARKFHAVNSADTAKKEPHLSVFVVYDHLGIDGVEDAVFGASRDDSVELEVVGCHLFQYTYAAIFGAVVEGDR